MIQPLLLGKIIMFFENYNTDGQRDLCTVYVYAAAMSLSSFSLTILQHLYYYHVQRTGMKMRVAMCHMIYRKVSEDPADAVVETSLYFFKSYIHHMSCVCPRPWVSVVNPWDKPPLDKLSTSFQMM